MNIVFIGAGRLATNLAVALHQNGHRIVQVYSRTIESAQLLAERVGSTPVNRMEEVVAEADAFVIAVSDAVLPQVISQLVQGREHQAFFHTAGSMPIGLFEDKAERYGVIYPMQTFSKERLVDFSEVSVFIEATDASTLQLAKDIAHAVSTHVYELSSEDRKQLHLAAVFACNFCNHCFALSAELLQKHGLPFSVMYPLINETVSKAMKMPPVQAQTGPAVRGDENVMQKQQQLLADQPLMRDIYRLMSQSIQKLSQEQQ